MLYKEFFNFHLFCTIFGIHITDRFSDFALQGGGGGGAEKGEVRDGVHSAAKCAVGINRHKGC